MAEFREVVKQYMRMCCLGSCEKCVLHGMDDFPCRTRVTSNPEEFERRVMKWAESHPEPKYPTWAEWLRGMNFHGMDIIPADIAEKLGIKPKGASDD